MIYQENPPIKYLAVLVLILAFVVIYSPWNLGIRELLSEEGRYAAISLETKFLTPSTMAHGEIFPYYYPLYPWLVAGTYKIGFSHEMGLRLVSILSLAGIAITVFVTSKRISGLQTAVVSAAAMMSSFIVMGKGIDGNPFVTAVFFLLLGWLTWYTNGVVKGDWNLAWITGAIFCTLAFYTIGWIAIFYFFLPLIFMRRPMTIWKKLSNYGFKIGIAIIIIFVSLLVFPRFAVVIQHPFLSEDISNIIPANYLSSLLTYPLELLWRVMPWTIAFWPAFCVAYYPLDKNPIFSRFLRTIFFTLFVFMWISPSKDSRTIILLLPALSILCGINYWLLVRRNGFVLKIILNVLTAIFVLISLFSLLLFLLPNCVWTNNFFILLNKSLFKNGVGFFSVYRIMGIIQTAAAAVLGIGAIYFRKRIKIWLYFLFVSVIFMLFFWGIIIPYRSQSNEAKNTAARIIADIGEDYSRDMTIFEGNDISDIYVLGTYLGCNIRKIPDYSMLPEELKDVYVFALSTPIFTERHWTKISSPIYKNKIITLWKGTKLNKRLTAAAEDI